MSLPLTQTQIQILDLLANSDFPPKQIARTMHLDDLSLKLHCSTIRQLLNVQTDLGAIKKSIEFGFIEYR